MFMSQTGTGSAPTREQAAVKILEPAKRMHAPGLVEGGDCLGNRTGTDNGSEANATVWRPAKH